VEQLSAPLSLVSSENVRCRHNASSQGSDMKEVCHIRAGAFAFIPSGDEAPPAHHAGS
jgi:hypothetical protein